MDDTRAVHCDNHSLRRPAYVCRHIAWGSGLGFFAPDDPSDDLQGWCEQCEQVRARCGGWDDESEEFAQIMLICDLCYQAARERNIHRAEAAE